MKQRRNPLVIAVTGPPGAGKTTLARALAEKGGRYYISTGDIARVVDPEPLARGEMADRAKLQTALESAVNEALVGQWAVVVDGAPREPGDMDCFPADTMVLMLTGRTDILIDRQLRRGRPGDEDPEIVTKRTREQERLLDLGNAEGWAFRTAGYGRTVNTSSKRPETILAHVLEYLDGERGEAY